MTWTYNPSLTSKKDKVRFLIGDRDRDAALLQDEEIVGAIALEGGVRQGAARCAETLAGYFTQQANKVTDDIGQTVEYANRAADFLNLAGRLRSASAMLGVPVAGGLTHSGKRVQELDTDRVAPTFTRELHEDVGADVAFSQVP